MESASLLKDDEESFLLRQLLNTTVKSNEEQPSESKLLLPNPGHCIKTRASTGEKVFMNICTSDQIPVPRDISEEELDKIIKSDDPTQFRVQMSIGEPHVELDKGGYGCTVYDIVVNPRFYSKTKDSQIFELFFLTLVFDGIENKYNVELSREWKILKNRKCFGKVSQQTIRTKSKPLIMEMETDMASSDIKQKEKLVADITEIEKPIFQIIKEPPNGIPDFLVAEINLPKVKRAQTVELSVGGDELVLQANPKIYYLATNLPYDVDPSETGAQFHKKTKVLTVTMPVVRD